MNQGLSFYIAQINPILGNIRGNTKKILLHIAKAKKEGADIIVFPELALTGYPPYDAFLHPAFENDYQMHLQTIKEASNDLVIILGHPAFEQEQCYNQSSVFYEGKTLLSYRKQHLPAYEIFNEKRYFQRGSPDAPTTFEYQGHTLKVCICADAWQPEKYLSFEHGPVDALIVINASPFDQYKVEKRHLMMRHLIDATEAPILYVNMTGGQDHILFDGQSMCLDATMDKPHSLCPYLTESSTTVHLAQQKWHTQITHPIPTKEARLFEALCMGLRDYVHKNGFTEVLLGVSGGIDSALCLALASHALGASNVKAMTLPSPYTSKETLMDAKALCQNFGVTCSEVCIDELYQQTKATLPFLKDMEAKDSLTLQNIQARLRGLLLMSSANHTNALLLSCGNKSELALGYCTLYGDMAGGFAPLGDVCKTEVVGLAKWYNQHHDQKIPASIIERQPSAELAPNQKDTDSLPPYDQLDAALDQCLENPYAPTALNTTEQQALLHKIQRQEFKRHQGPPYTRVSTSSLRYDRRYPITLPNDVEPA